MCTYAGGKCLRDPWEGSTDGFCICHATENSDAAEEVWEAARLEAASKAADFTGWRFPADDTGFNGLEFPGCADFSDSVFFGHARFLHSTFDGDVTFKRTRFRAETRFRHAIGQDRSGTRDNHQDESQGDDERSARCHRHNCAPASRAAARYE